MAQTDGYNSDIKSGQVQKLAELFPEVVTEGKIDWDKLKVTLGEDIDLGEKYGLSWKGKSGVFAKIQEKTVSTLHPQPDESVDWDTTQNMFIEGDNLEALKVLHKAYYGKIKMIYIDPPYNTGNDFVYNDNFAKTRRQNAMDEGSIDEEGNVTRDDGLRINTGGHKHSNWLDMMYPRLFLARNLLRQDGVIFVSIDDNEVHNLRLMMNEIFGEENFVAQIIWQKKYTQSNDTKNVSYTHEYIVCFARSIGSKDSILNKLPRTKEQDARYTNPDNDSRGPWKAIPLHARSGNNPERISFSNGLSWAPPAGTFNRFKQGKIDELEEDGRIYFGKNGNSVPVFKRFLSEVGDIVPVSLWKHDEVGSTDKARKQIKELIAENVFDTPKPVGLMQRLCQIGTNVDGSNIVLDFFGGSGTFAHAVTELNAEDGGDRKWITVQLPELTDEKSEAYKAGYKTISDISRERIRRAGVKIQEELEKGKEELDGKIHMSQGMTGTRSVNEEFSRHNASTIDEQYSSIETGERVSIIYGRDDPKHKYKFHPKGLDIGFRSYVLGDSNFKKWNDLMREPSEMRQATLDQLNPIEEGVSDADLLTEILLKRGISPLVEIDKHDSFVFIPSETLAISLTRQMTEELFSKILAKSPSQLILLDQAFRNDVNLKTNLMLQAEKQNIAVEVL